MICCIGTAEHGALSVFSLRLLIYFLQVAVNGMNAVLICGIGFWLPGGITGGVLALAKTSGLDRQTRPADRHQRAGQCWANK